MQQDIADNIEAFAASLAASRFALTKEGRPSQPRFKDLIGGQIGMYQLFPHAEPDHVLPSNLPHRLSVYALVERWIAVDAWEQIYVKPGEGFKLPQHKAFQLAAAGHVEIQPIWWQGKPI